MKRERFEPGLSRPTSARDATPSDTRGSILPVSQPQRRCLFCGSQGSSGEHIIPRWIGRALMPQPMPGISVVYRHVSANPEAGISVREKRAKEPAFRTRAFCRECNGGWMSRLESDVQEVLEPLLFCRSLVLTAAHQRLLTLWVTKTVLAFQSIEHPTTTFARPKHFTELFRSQAPLADSQIWLGANDHGEPAWYRAHGVRVPAGDPSRFDGFGSTLTVGHAVFYMLVGYDRPIGLRLRYEAAAAFKEIWPGRARPVSWPPRLALRASGRQELPEYLAHHSVLPA